MAEAKVQLHRSADPAHGIDLALLPGVGYGRDVAWAVGDSAGDGLQTALALLVGFNLPRLQVALSPQVRYQTGTPFASGLVSVGGTIALGRMHGPNRVYPALAIWKSADPTDLRATLLGAGGLEFQPALVVGF
jgi:hypothetical protein